MSCLPVHYSPFRLRAQAHLSRRLNPEIKLNYPVIAHGRWEMVSLSQKKEADDMLDGEKTGRFIAERRRARGWTQDGRPKVSTLKKLKII